MDKGVYPVNTSHQPDMPNEEFLDLDLNEHPEFLLDLNDLQRMLPRDIDGPFLERDSSKSPAQLICLSP